MRMLDRQKIPYELMNYECEEFVDGMDVADKLGQDYEMTFKTLVTLGKSGNYYVYAIPVHRELDMKKVIHESAKQQDKIAVSGGRRGVQILLQPEDLAKASGATFADIIKEE